MWDYEILWACAQKSCTSFLLFFLNWVLTLGMFYLGVLTSNSEQKVVHLGILIMFDLDLTFKHIFTYVFQ